MFYVNWGRQCGIWETLMGFFFLHFLMFLDQTSHGLIGRTSRQINCKWIQSLVSALNGSVRISSVHGLCCLCIILSKSRDLGTKSCVSCPAQVTQQPKYACWDYILLKWNNWNFTACFCHVGYWCVNAFLSPSQLPICSIFLP